MKTLFITAAALMLTTTSAFAFDITEQVYLDNTIDFVYSVEAEDFTIDYEVELGYNFANDFTVYASTDYNLRDIDFKELEVGMDYVVPGNDLTLTTAVLLDENLEYTDVELRASFSF
jgi:hypothetical protein